MALPRQNFSKSPFAKASRKLCTPSWRSKGRVWSAKHLYIHDQQSHVRNCSSVEYSHGCGGYISGQVPHDSAVLPYDVAARQKGRLRTVAEMVRHGKMEPAEGLKKVQTVAPFASLKTQMDQLNLKPEDL